MNTYPYHEPYQPTTRADVATIKAGNAYFTHVRTPLYDALVYQRALRKPNKLATAKPQLRLHATKIPRPTVQEAIAFCRTVAQRYRTEAYLTLYYDPATQHYRFAAPPQHNAHGHVIAHPMCAPDGYLEIGSLHSHPGAAFHSQTDIHDEQRLDGIHLIVGHLHRADPQLVGTISVRGHRFPINPPDLLELPWEYDGEWLEQLKGTTP